MNPIKQPEKKETLAGKQKERSRRLNHLRSRLPELSPQRWVGIGEIFGLIILFLVNLWLLLPFFNSPNQFNVFSAPVIPVLAKATENLISFGIRFWLLVFLVFFPLSFYFFVKEIAERKLIAFLASFLVILPTGVFLRSRIDFGILGEDGAHIASLTLIPFVCLLLLRFLKRGAFWSGILAALGATLVALTSPLGFFTLLIFMGGITFSEMLLGGGRLKLVRFLIVLVLVAGFSAFWYHPKFVFLTIASPQGQVIKRTLANLFPLSFFLVPILGVFGFLLFENRPQLQPMFIAFFLTFAFGLFSLGAGVAHPFPSRFLPTFGISLALFLGILIVWLFDFLRTSSKMKRFPLLFPYRRLIAFGLIGLVFVSILVIIVFSRSGFWHLEETRVLGAPAEQKAGIWEIKEEGSQLESFFGYGVTGLTIIGIVVLKKRLTGNNEKI